MDHFSVLIYDILYISHMHRHSLVIYTTKTTLSYRPMKPSALGVLPNPVTPDRPAYPSFNCL